jgi:hypothetical protein
VWQISGTALVGIIPTFVGMMEWRMRKEGHTRHHHPPRSWPKLPERAELEHAAAMFPALGDPARLRLLARLAGRDVCAPELAELHDVRLVKRRREAKGYLLFAFRHSRSAFGGNRHEACCRKAVAAGPAGREEKERTP